MNWFLHDDPALGAAPQFRVGLLVGLRPPPHWGDAVRSLTGYAEVCVVDPEREEADAWLASSADAPGVPRAQATGRPVVVLPPAPATGIDLREYPPMTPFVRARWRRRFGLPAQLVVDAAQLPAEVRATGLAVAAAVVATGADLLVEALAWSAPTATDAASAAAIGARPDVEVVVGDAAAARALAADDRRAAVMGRAGRRLVERLYDPVRAAAELRHALGLTARPPSLQHRLDELWTPADARIRRRAAELVGLP